MRAARGRLALENFSPAEIACRGLCTLLVNDPARELVVAAPVRGLRRLFDVASI